MFKEGYWGHVFIVMHFLFKQTPYFSIIALGGIERYWEPDSRKYTHPSNRHIVERSPADRFTSLLYNMVYSLPLPVYLQSYLLIQTGFKHWVYYSELFKEYDKKNAVPVQYRQSVMGTAR